MYKVMMVAGALLISAAVFAAGFSKDIVGSWKVKEAQVDGKVILKGGKNAECSFCDLLNSGIPLVFDASGKVQYGEGGNSSLMFYYISGNKLVISQSALQSADLRRIKTSKEKGIEVIGLEETKAGISLLLTANGHNEVYLLEK